MSQLSKSSGQRVRTDLMVCVQTLNVTVVTLKWKTPPSMNWPKQEEAGCEMEGEMMIRNKLVFDSEDHEDTPPYVRQKAVRARDPSIAWWQGRRRPLSERSSRGVNGPFPMPWRRTKDVLT